MIKPPPGAVQFTFQKTFEINLRPELKYLIKICDAKYTAVSPNPAVVPGTLLTLNNNSGLSLVYFNVCPTQSQSGPECVMSGDKTRPSDEAGEPLPGGGAVQAVQ